MLHRGMHKAIERPAKIVAHFPGLDQFIHRRNATIQRAHVLGERLLLACRNAKVAQVLVSATFVTERQPLSPRIDFARLSNHTAPTSPAVIRFVSSRRVRPIPSKNLAVAPLKNPLPVSRQSNAPSPAHSP